MHYQFLIEDISSAVLIEEVMKRVIRDSSVDTYNCKSFKGIGGFTKKKTVKEMHTGKLLNDLVIYMRGYQKSFQGIEAVLMIVLDNDNNDPYVFRTQLESVASDHGITMDHVFCIAVEEMEAWLLGDELAIKKAYPNMKASVLHSYQQDSICGTWEVLADVVYKGGISTIRKNKMSYMEIGKLKSEWAARIAQYMDFDNNKSPSFCFFISSVTSRLT